MFDLFDGTLPPFEEILEELPGLVELGRIVFEVAPGDLLDHEGIETLEVLGNIAPHIEIE